MTFRLLPLLSLFLMLSGAAAHADAVPVADPDLYAKEVFTQITEGKFHDAARHIAETFGQPGTEKKLEHGFRHFEGKTFDFGKKVYDKDYNGALRQIIYMAYFRKTGFIYFRFTYKMTSRGWYLTNYLFKDGGSELFPKGFIEGAE